VGENDADADERAIAQTIARAAAQVDSEDVEQRRRAVQELCDLCRNVRTRARAALPLLLESLADTDDRVGESALYGLRYCAPDSIEPLIDCLSSPDPLVRRRACASLGNIGDAALAACDMLRTLLKDPVQEVRSRAAWALGLIHDTSNRTIAALFAMMRSGVAKDRSSALHALGNLGKVLTDVAPLQANQHEIIEALEDEHDDVRWGACYVLESLALEPSRHMELLAGHLADRSERVRSLAIGQMKGLAGKANLVKHIESMCAVVCGGGHSAREMCEVLALLGPSARAAVPALIEALRSDHPFVVVEAAKALWKIDRRVDEALPHLARLFDDIVDAEVVCDAICEIGPAAAPLVDSVIQALQSDSWDLQWAAADALGLMASGDPRVVAALATALGHASPIVCSAAVAALAQIGEPALPAL
jgi:HEAT repeat protein